MNENLKAIANSFAEEYCSDAIYPAHLFKAILHKEIGLVHFIESELDKDYFYLQDWADVQMQVSPRAVRPMRDLEYSDESVAVLEEAENYMVKFGLDEFTDVCVLTALVTPGVGFSFDQLKTLPLTPSDISAKLGVGVSVEAPDMGGDELIDELIQVLSSYRNDDLDFEEAYDISSAMTGANMQLGFCRQMNDYGLEKESWMLLLHVCCSYYCSQNFILDIDGIQEFFGMRTGHVQMRLFRRNRHELLTKEIMESAGGELANANEWCLSRRAANDLMSELCPVTTKSTKQGVIDAESIGKKALFYPSKTTRQVSELENLLSQEKFRQVQESLEAHGMRKGFACLFYGTPGTGKTETVLQIARKTGRDIMQVDMSQMRDKFVGESEKNVKQIFTRYRRICKESDQTPILLLNEADALLSVRLTNVEHSVDQMENTMQNILLQEMENFDGILIATTNLTQNLDGAFDRRFLYKVEFLKPTPEESRHIWQAMLPEISEEDAWALAKQYAFSGGQIENIARKQIVNSILFPEEGRDLEKIRQACDSEYLNKTNTRPIGFC